LSLGSQTMTSVSLVIFDFDRTLSVEHVFGALSGRFERLVPPPYAKTERGQLVRLFELDAREPFYSMGGFAQSFFGGPERVEQLRALLMQLTSAGIECVVLSKGLVGPMRRCLEHVGILSFFSKTVGTIRDINGKTPYDEESQLWSIGEDERFLGAPEDLVLSSKKLCVERWLRDCGLHFCNAVYIDDDLREVRSISDLCPTIHVKDGAGMGPQEFALLRSMTNTAPSLGSVSIPRCGSFSVAIPPVPILDRSEATRDLDSSSISAPRATERTPHLQRVDNGSSLRFNVIQGTTTMNAPGPILFDSTVVRLQSVPYEIVSSARRNQAMAQRSLAGVATAGGSLGMPISPMLSGAPPPGAGEDLRLQGRRGCGPSGATTVRMHAPHHHSPANPPTTTSSRDSSSSGEEPALLSQRCVSRRLSAEAPSFPQQRCDSSSASRWASPTGLRANSVPPESPVWTMGAPSPGGDASPGNIASRSPTSSSPPARRDGGNGVGGTSGQPNRGPTDCAAKICRRAPAKSPTPRGGMEISSSRSPRLQHATSLPGTRTFGARNS